MSLSGSNSGVLRPYTGVDLIEEACRRAGIGPEKLTNEIVQAALDQVNLILGSLVNRGIQLWKRQKLILPCYLNTAQMPLPPGNNNVVTLNRRSLSRQIGTPFTDQGGDPTLAFDDNFATATVQLAGNGSVGCTFATATAVTTVGILFGGAGQWTLFAEYTLDGTHWTTAEALDVDITAAGQWVWVDIDGAPSNTLGWRVRNLGATPLDIAELFFGNTPQEVNLGMINLDDYSTLPNQTQGGQVLEWYQQRNAAGPTLYVWPVPNDAARYDTLVVWASQNLDTLSQATQTLDVPARWYDAITAMLARRLCRSLPEADVKRYPFLRDEENEALGLAVAEERDPAPTNYDLGLFYYTRL